MPIPPIRPLEDLHTEAQTLDGILYAADELFVQITKLSGREAFAVACLLRVATEMANKLHHDLDCYELRAAKADGREAEPDAA